MMPNRTTVLWVATAVAMAAGCSTSPAAKGPGADASTPPPGRDDANRDDQAAVQPGTDALDSARDLDGSILTDAPMARADARGDRPIRPDTRRADSAGAARPVSPAVATSRGPTSASAPSLRS